MKTRLRREIFGKPDGWWWRLVCGLLGHDWYECDPETCCGESWCWRCEAPRG